MHTGTQTHTNFLDKSNFKKPGMCWSSTCAWFNKQIIHKYQIFGLQFLLNLHCKPVAKHNPVSGDYLGKFVGMGFDGGRTFSE